MRNSKRQPHNRNSWSKQGNIRRLRKDRARSIPAWTYAVTGLGMGGLLSVAVILWPAGEPVEARQQSAAAQRTFTLCHTGGGTNCVVDGDTIWLDGVKIRVADIDAPETHPPRCAREADLGTRATNRLLALVNAGLFSAEPAGDRDEDRYGRKLRVLVRDGQSLGGQLVQDGLARSWDGARHPWCP